MQTGANALRTCVLVHCSMQTLHQATVSTVSAQCERVGGYLRYLSLCLLQPCAKKIPKGQQYPKPYGIQQQQGGYLLQPCTAILRCSRRLMPSSIVELIARIDAHLCNRPSVCPSVCNPQSRFAQPPFFKRTNLKPLWKPQNCD